MGVEEKWREKLIDTFRTDINFQLNLASVKNVMIHTDASYDVQFPIPPELITL